MRQDGTYIDLAPIKMDRRDKPEIIAANIEHDVSGYRISMWKRLSQLGYGVKRGPGHDAIPCGQWHAALRVAPGELAQAPPGYDVHSNGGRHSRESIPH